MEFQADGATKKVEALPSLEVTVEVTTLKVPLGAEFPVEGKPEYHHEITRGRLGGHRGAGKLRILLT